MMRKWYGLAAVSLVAAACGDVAGSDGQTGVQTAALAAVFASTPVGYGDLSTSYVGVSAAGVGDAPLWLGGGREASFGRGALMGGGLADAFAGGIRFDGRGGHRGPFGGGLRCPGTFDATTGRVACPAETRNGITVTRSAQYTTAAGVVQQAFDTLTTNAVDLQTTATGTVTFSRAADSSGGRGHDGRGGPGGPGGRGGHGPGWGHGRGSVGRLLGDTSTILTATTAVTSASTQSVSGLAPTSTQRTVSAASRGTESTTGTSSRGAFTAARTVGDTTRGLVIPVATSSNAHPYPTAGTVIRAMQATLTYAGQPALTASRREVVTYDGSATASVTITENGTSRTCTRALPRGQLACP